MWQKTVEKRAKDSSSTRQVRRYCTHRVPDISPTKVFPTPVQHSLLVDRLLSRLQIVGDDLDRDANKGQLCRQLYPPVLVVVL